MNNMVKRPYKTGSPVTEAPHNPTVPATPSGASAVQAPMAEPVGPIAPLIATTEIPQNVELRAVTVTDTELTGGSWNLSGFQINVTPTGIDIQKGGSTPGEPIRKDTITAWAKLIGDQDYDAVISITATPKVHPVAATELAAEPVITTTELQPTMTELVEGESGGV